MFSFLSALQSGLCPLAVLIPQQEDAIHVHSQEGALTRGGLVRALPDASCAPSEVRVEVLSQVYFYRYGVELAPIGSQVCVSLQEIQPLSNHALYLLHPPPDDMGLVSDSVLLNWSYSNICLERYIHTKEEGHLDFSQLRWVQVLSMENALLHTQLTSQWFSEFGNWIWGRVWVNDWGRVALPLTYFVRSEQQNEYAKEKLRSPEQKSRATVAYGPRWLHFLGTDPLFSDVWGTPEYVQQLMFLTKVWNTWCQERDFVSNKDSCLMQIGDIAWFNPKNPDPLGHKTHDQGTCVDMRLFRSDASRYEAYWNKGDDRKGFSKAYDKKLNAAFIDFMWDQGASVILFSDKSTHAKWAPHHNDHIHVCFDDLK